MIRCFWQTLQQPEEEKIKDSPATVNANETQDKNDIPEIVAPKGGKRADEKDGIEQVTKVEVAVVQRNPDRVTRRPRELLVKVRLPGIKSAAGLDIKIDNAEKSVKVDHLEDNLHAQVKLPFPVDDENGSATFEAEKSLLVLTLPVVAPVEAPEDALQHLEKEGEANSEEDKAPKAAGEEDHVMLRQQALRGMALPRKLCDTGLCF